MSARDRRTITLGAEANQVLARLGNHSAYLDSIVRQHAREWTEALAMLRAKHWTEPEIRASCEALVGYSLTLWGRGGDFVAAELERIQERTQIFTQNEVVAARRARLFKQLREDSTVSWTLATLVREYHVPNDDLRDALGNRMPHGTRNAAEGVPRTRTQHR